MSTIINGTSSAITFPDTTVQNTAFTTGAVTQSAIATGVAGTGPAFSAYANATTSLVNGGYTKIIFQSKEFDTATCYDATIARFTPTVAGYYQINAAVQISSGTTSEVLVVLYKNGSAYKYGNDIAATTVYAVNMSALVYLNGTTDYAEIYCYSGTSGKTAANSIPGTFFQASMVRSA